MAQTSFTGKRIGFREATSLGVGGIIGAGIFVLSGTASGSAGPGVLLAFAIAFAASLILGLCYAELSSMHDDSGGPYAYAKAHLPGWVATVSGWANWGAWICASAYVGIGFGEHVHLLLPFLDPRLAAVPLVALFTFLNLLGLRVSGRVQFVIMLFEIGLLLAFISFGATKIDTSLYVPFLPNGWSGVMAAALVGFLALTGWDAIVVAAEEIERPRRNIPASILASLGIVFILYAGLLFIINGLISWDVLGRSETPVSDSAQLLLGGAGAAIISIVIVVALTTTMNSFLVVISRSSFVLARDHRAPAVLARTTRQGTPWVSVLVAGSSQLAMVWFSNLRFAVAATGFLYTVTFISSIIALLVSRHRGRAASFRVPWHPVLPVLALGLCLVFISGSGTTGATVGLSWLIAGLTCAYLVKRFSFGTAPPHTRARNVTAGVTGATDSPGTAPEGRG